MKSFTQIRRFSSLVAIVALAGWLASCSSSSTPADNTVTTVTPKAGTTYTYHVHSKDSTDGSPAVVKDGDSTSLVLYSGGSYAGRTNVIALLNDTGQTTSDTTFYILEPDGDVSVYLGKIGAQGFTLINPNPWLRLPFGSKKTNDTLITVDTTINYGGYNIPTKIRGVADYIGADNTVSGHSADAVKFTITLNGTYLIINVNVVASQTYALDRTIGGYVHSIYNIAFPPILTSAGSTTFKEKTLSSVSLVK